MWKNIAEAVEQEEKLSNNVETVTVYISRRQGECRWRMWGDYDSKNKMWVGYIDGMLCELLCEHISTYI